MNVEMYEESLKDKVIGINQANLENLTMEEEYKSRSIIKEIEKTGARIKIINSPQIPKDNLR